ncbi:hypothetical protein L1049_021919 [Liquidambar formosana]|uniref:Uncharacterized protein n=1 Tax=Liquidambar formosana TaxID=63359 RepID=A0AAP0N437_LIQFO
MEILQSPTALELEVAHILLEMPHVHFQSSQRPRSNKRSRFLSRVATNWPVKRRRSSAPNLSDKNGKNLCHGEETLISSSLVTQADPVLAIPPSLPLLNPTAKPYVVGGASGSETRPLSSSVTESSDATLKLSEQNLAKKTQTEDLSEVLSAVSQQKQVLFNGIEDAAQLYDRVKAYRLQLEEKERELNQLLEQEKTSPRLQIPVICDSQSSPTDQVTYSAESRYSDNPASGLKRAHLFDLNLPPTDTDFIEFI